MAIKSIKLKFYFRRDQYSLYQQVWNTHRIFNEGIAYYLKQLLLLRQIPAADLVDPKSDLLRAARAAQSANGRSKIGTDEEILTLLRKLYEDLIPASQGKKSNAQMLSRAFLSALVDAKSVAGLGVAKKRKQHTADEPAGNQLLIDLRQKYGLLPLFKSYSDYLGNWTKRGVCTTWDRDMFQQSIERLCSWESWNIRVAAEKMELQKKVEKLADALMPAPDWFDRLKQYEQERKIELDLIAIPSEHPYRILKSGIRGWHELREQWCAVEVKTKDALIDLVTELQRELRGDFGDTDVFHWLARPENHFIWNYSEDHLAQFVKLNEAIEKRERAKEQAQLTMPDPIFHPVWARLDSPGGNLQWYAIRKTPTEFEVSLVVLTDEAGQIVERVISVPLAWSTQFEKILVKDYATIEGALAPEIARQKNDSKVQWVEWCDPGTKHRFWGKLGGAKIQFERSSLEKGANYFDTYLNVSINYFPAISDELTKAFTMVKPDETAPWTVVDYKPEILDAGNWAAKSKPGIEGLAAGLRVMSVSIKQKALAVCSVFEVQDKATELSIPIAGTHWHAAHKRSFVLRLPGEEEQLDINKKRTAVVKERQDLRNKLKKLSRILSLAAKEKKEDREELVKLLRKTDFMDEEILLAKIEKQLAASKEQWQEYILGIHKELEHDLGREIEAWRKKYRRKSMELRNVCGLSLWWINELTETRKLMNGWSAHARKPREIVRARALGGERRDKKAREVDLDRRLLNHINHLKDDRLKKGADLIVMSALGYAYSDKKRRWTVRHTPCRVILFQDISTYRTDRALSKKDNARLMAWSHRSIPRAVAHQGEIYGVVTGLVRSNNLNQTHARSGGPAVRMIQVEEEYLEQLWFARNYLRELAKRHILSKSERRNILDLPKAERKAKLLERVRPGMFIPWDTGDILGVGAKTAMERAGKGNAQINAAQMIQRLFWERQLVISKLYCVGSDEAGYVPVHVGKRLEASLGYGILKLNPGWPGFEYASLTKRQYNAAVGVVEDDDEEGEEEETSAVASPGVQVKQMFFRDPTGFFAPSNLWYKADAFWRNVEQTLDSLLY